MNDLAILGRYLACRPSQQFKFEVARKQQAVNT